MRRSLKLLCKVGLYRSRGKSQERYNVTRDPKRSLNIVLEDRPTYSKDKAAKHES